jgi:hypothetical protein
MCAVGSLTTERVTQYVGEQGKENRWPDDQPRGGAQDAQRPQPTWSSSKRGLEVVTGERLEIERLTSRSEEGRWKSTHRGNSLAAYPTSRTGLTGGMRKRTARQRALSLPNGNVEISTYRDVKASLRPLCFQEIGSTTVRTCAASQPVLTPYTLLEIARIRQSYLPFV